MRGHDRGLDRGVTRARRDPVVGDDGRRNQSSKPYELEITHETTAGNAAINGRRLGGHSCGAETCAASAWRLRSHRATGGLRPGVARVVRGPYGEIPA